MFYDAALQAEVRFLGALHHPNLVKLIGYCAEDSNRLLVYEYMSRGSLENHLFSSKSEAQKKKTNISLLFMKDILCRLNTLLIAFLQRGEMEVEVYRGQFE